MKNRNLNKFIKRNTHKRRSKDAARAELMRALRESGTNIDGAKIIDSFDEGRRARRSTSPHSDELATRGVFTGSRSGFGFVDIGEGRDIFIPERNTLGAIDGDLVEIIYHSYKNHFGEEKTEGRVKKIIEYGRKTVIGEIEERWVRYGRRRYREFILISDNARIYPPPRIEDLGGATTGDKVEARLIRSGGELSCEVICNFGPADERSANYGAILAECEIPESFTKEELEEAEIAARVPLSSEGRVDRTGEIIFTIDGEGAKDLDDAVSLRRLPGGKWRLGVHIADVSYYVKEKTHLDRCSMARGTSVYFTDKVVPMLPPALSNGACSLNAGEDKYTISAIIDLDGDGEIISLSLTPSVIRSAVRGVYSEVNALLSGDASPALREKYKRISPTLIKMQELYEILRSRREKCGYIDFDSDEAVIVLDESGDPCDIIPRERGLSERIIEQFMLVANEAVASYLSENSIPCVYRIHEEPPKDKMDEFVEFVHNLGFDTSFITKRGADAKALSKLLREAERRELSEPISYTLLRTMAKAKYSEIKHFHFGLGIEDYCHFTSPIRRLSDLATHRIIRRVLFEGKAPKLYASYAKRAAAAATEGELRALTAERRIEDLYKCVYMSKFVGCEFEGRVSSVTAFGLFVKLPNTCEGLVPIGDMPGFFSFDEKNVSLVSKDRIWRLGETVTVCLEECDIQRGKLRFSIV